jgi:DNA-directed RNA polymerases I, II, and III subunit RPABC1
MTNMKVIIKEMCSQRGYTFLHEEEDEIIYEECKIFFSKNTKININYMKELIQLMETQNIHHVILIYTGNITISVKKIIEMTQYFNIELFKESEFNFNITKHRLVPKHTKVEDPHEMKQIRKHIKNLPLILRDDFIVKFYAFKRGDIIRVERLDNSIVYRCVH